MTGIYFKFIINFLYIYVYQSAFQKSWLLVTTRGRYSKITKQRALQVFSVYGALSHMPRPQTYHTSKVFELIDKNDDYLLHVRRFQRSKHNTGPHSFRAPVAGPYVEFSVRRWSLGDKMYGSHGRKPVKIHSELHAILGHFCHLYPH